jgi:hypothetical protein
LGSGLVFVAVFAATSVCCRSGTSLESDGNGAAAGDAGTSGDSGAGGSGGSAGVSSPGGGTMTGGAAGQPWTGGQGGGAPRPSLEELASGEDEPYRLAIDDRYVFWISGTELRRVALTGGDVSTLATGAGLRSLAVASGYVYFTDGLAGVVARVDREGGAVEELGGGTYPSGIFVDDIRVYWSNGGMSVGETADGTLATALLDDPGGTVLADGLHQPAAVVVDGEHVYFTSTAQGCTASSSGNSCYGGGVGRVPIDGGEPVPVDAEGTPGELVLGERGLYWVVEPGRVKLAPRGGGAVQTLTTLSGEGSGIIAVDADSFYLSSSLNGRVLRLPLDGGEPLPLVVDLGTTGGIAVAGEWVYVAATSQGRILRVKKDGSAARPDGPITGPCPSPVGSADEIASTPREDANLELLALSLDEGNVVATDETYERVIADVAGMRALEPGLADIDYWPGNDGKTMILIPTEIARQSMQDGDYSAWDCLNDFYGLESPPTMSSSLVIVTLDGMYSLDVLASVYGELPGVERAEPNSLGGDGPTICVLRDGANYEYVIDRAGGDCPAGCTTHEAHHFVSTAAGMVEALEVWDSASGEGVPSWYTRVCR